MSSFLDAFEGVDFLFKFADSFPQVHQGRYEHGDQIAITNSIPSRIWAFKKT